MNDEKHHLIPLSVAALGVVFGDIGTSPLYAIRECFHGEYGIAVTVNNIYGVLSLMFWTLTMIVSVKIPVIYPSGWYDKIGCYTDASFVP